MSRMSENVTDGCKFRWKKILAEKISRILNILVHSMELLRFSENFLLYLSRNEKLTSSSFMWEWTHHVPYFYHKYQEFLICMKQIATCNWLMECDSIPHTFSAVFYLVRHSNHAKYESKQLSLLLRKYFFYISCRDIVNLQNSDSIFHKELFRW